MQAVRRPDVVSGIDSGLRPSDESSLRNYPQLEEHFKSVIPLDEDESADRLATSISHAEIPFVWRRSLSFFRARWTCERTP